MKAVGPHAHLSRSSHASQDEERRMFAIGHGSTRALWRSMAACTSSSASPHAVPAEEGQGTLLPPVSVLSGAESRSRTELRPGPSRTRAERTDDAPVVSRSGNGEQDAGEAAAAALVEGFGGRGDDDDPGLVWAHGLPGYLDLASEVMVTFKKLAAQGPKGGAAGGTASSRRQHRALSPKVAAPAITLRAVGYASLYNCLRAAAYSQPYLEPVAGASSLALMISEFELRPAAPDGDATATRVAAEPRHPQGGGEASTAGSGSKPGAPKRPGFGDWKKVKRPDDATLEAYRAEGALLVDFKMYRIPKVSAGSGFPCGTNFPVGRISLWDGFPPCGQAIGPVSSAPFLPPPFLGRAGRVRGQPRPGGLQTAHDHTGVRQ